jgi:hypothetical protein
MTWQESIGMFWLKYKIKSNLLINFQPIYRIEIRRIDKLKFQILYYTNEGDAIREFCKPQALKKCFNILVKDKAVIKIN